MSMMAGLPASTSMPYVEKSPAAMAGGVRGVPCSGLGETTSPVSAALAHSLVGGQDQIPNPHLASPSNDEFRHLPMVKVSRNALERRSGAH